MNRFLLVVGVFAVLFGAALLIWLTVRNGAAVATVSESIKKVLLNYFNTYCQSNGLIFV